ncbi:MAG: DUF2314 domain-containing protein [Rhodobacteraceae bacterium]|nr:DUF2314 domain-containing protein [Paracoccaceae bacterium]
MKFLTAVFFALAIIAPIQSRAQDQVIHYSEADKTMNAAIARAQETFPQFMVQYYEDEEVTGAFLDAFSVKVEMAASGSTSGEHIWVSPFIETETGFLGLLANEPVELPGLTYGSEVTFTLSQISDWSYQRDGRAFGNFTTRVMLPSLAPDIAQNVRDYLTPAPMPEDWRP